MFENKLGYVNDDRIFILNEPSL